MSGNLNSFKVKKFLQDNGILISFLVIVILLSFASPHFLTSANIFNILRQISTIGIATIGVGMLIVMGAIDLSIGSVFALAGIIGGLAISTGTGGYALHPIMGFVAGIATGLIAGGFNGVIVAKARIPAFIVTMGTMSIGRGLALIFARGMPVGNFPDGFNWLGSAFLGPVPFPVIIFVGVAVLTWFIIEKRPMGRYIYAIGSNEDAARAAGIDVDTIKIKTYLYHGALIGLAASVLASRMRSAAPALGIGFELDAIAGSIIGGVSFTGGIGKVQDMVLGALLIGVINNGMDLLGVGAFYKQVVMGSLILVAVLIDRKRSGRG